MHTIRGLGIRSDRRSRSGRPSASCSSFISILCNFISILYVVIASSSPCSEVLLRAPGPASIIARAPTRRASVRPRAPCAAGPARGAEAAQRAAQQPLSGLACPPAGRARRAARVCARMRTRHGHSACMSELGPSFPPRRFQFRAPALKTVYLIRRLHLRAFSPACPRGLLFHKFFIQSYLI
jgi:hypothetical protein